jgi:hypothetical protein
MKNSLLFIKWSVGSVQVGKSPGAALGDPEKFLDYCLSNVYSYLPSNTLAVLQVFQASPEALSLAEFDYLADAKLVARQAGLQELLVSNMVTMNIAAHGAVFDAQYDLAELCQMYLRRHHHFPSEVSERFKAKFAAMGALRERASWPTHLLSDLPGLPGTASDLT